MPFGQGQSHSIALITSKVNRIFSQTPDSRLPIPDSRFPNFVTKIKKLCYNIKFLCYSKTVVVKRPWEEPANGFCEAGVAGSWSPSTRIG
ncbi:hypothetical protein [Moorena sp. SIO4A5]|uniref:hypothetical protein n=1 Tax=Moorena sp. SIO4A5 TaxID=2607838 RepID=UPI0013CA0319|nr:hypothetical protein [Moorena sp. SIO4A5]NEO24826.1 hypothetical protein [Moorena sp. SIO4A5]